MKDIAEKINKSMKELNDKCNNTVINKLNFKQCVIMTILHNLTLISYVELLMLNSKIQMSWTWVYTFLSCKANRHRLRQEMCNCIGKGKAQ